MANIYGVQFDEVNDYFDLEDNAAWDLIRSNGNQFYAFWLEIPDNTGGAFQYFFSNNSFQATNSINLYTPESGNIILKATIQQGTITTINTGASTLDKALVIFEYNNTSGLSRLRMCLEGGTVVNGNAGTLNNDVIGSNWNLGRRQDGNVDRYFGGIVYNVAKGSTILSDVQVENLASDFLNYDPNDEFTPDIYFPMNEGTGQDITDDVLGLTGTGISFPTNDSQWVLAGQSAGGVDLTPAVTENTNEAITPTVALTTLVELAPIATESTSEALSPVISLTTNIGLNPVVTENTSESLSPNIALTATVVMTPDATENTSEAIAPTVALSSVVVVSPQVTESENEALSPTISLATGITLQPNTTESNSEAISPSIVLSGPLGLSPTVTENISEAVSPDIVFSVPITITPSTTEVISQALSPVVFIGAKQVIDNFTIGYADAYVNADYTDSQITVNYSNIN